MKRAIYIVPSVALLALGCAVAIEDLGPPDEDTVTHGQQLDKSELPSPQPATPQHQGLPGPETQTNADPGRPDPDPWMVDRDPNRPDPDPWSPSPTKPSSNVKD
jgi:hypothetical protein